MHLALDGVVLAIRKDTQSATDAPALEAHGLDPLLECGVGGAVLDGPHLPDLVAALGVVLLRADADDAGLPLELREAGLARPLRHVLHPEADAGLGVAPLPVTFEGHVAVAPDPEELALLGDHEP